MSQSAESLAALESQKAVFRRPEGHADIREIPGFRVLPVAEKAIAVVVTFYRVRLCRKY